MTDSVLQHTCPICSGKSKLVASHELCGFNESIFAGTAEYRTCSKCNYVWLSTVSSKQLTEYYSNEAIYFDSTHFAVDAPGNITKFKRYTELVSQILVSFSTVADIGCGRGGFLNWLKSEYPQLECFGVDLDVKSLPVNKQNAPHFKNGDIYNLPFSRSEIDVVTCFHVLEHALDVNTVLEECARVLKDDGYLILEVPDGSRYSKQTPCKGFWVGVQEHINHFSPHALSMALRNAGFYVRSIEQGIAESSDVDYPFLAITAQKRTRATTLPVKTTPTHSISTYVQDSLQYFQEVAKEKNNLACQNILFWGVSMLLMYILPYIDAKEIAICDASQFKQGQRLLTETILSPEEAAHIYNNEETCLVISSVVNYDAIHKAAVALGWNPKQIFKLV